uniref:Ankyrin repeat protein n=1 Tax=viral metagenome TaxID=1070528 RepID=A0A6C0CCM4_9ZZZZ
MLLRSLRIARHYCHTRRMIIAIPQRDAKTIAQDFDKVSLVTNLIKSGIINLNIADDDKFELISRIINSDIDMIRMIIEHRYDHDYINHSLYDAITHAQRETVMKVYAVSASQNHKVIELHPVLAGTENVFRHLFLEHAFHWCCGNGHLEIAQWFYKTWKINLHSGDEYAFRWACLRGHLDVAKWLAQTAEDNGKKINYRIGYTQFLERSHTQNYDKMTEWLVQLIKDQK